MKKNILKIILFLLILLIILIIISYIFTPKNNSEESGMKETRAMGILGEKENSIDVIMYGDSETIASNIPMKLWDKYGYTMYICGNPGQTLPDTCKMIYDTLKKQKPKILILESNNIYIPVSITVPAARIINITLPITEYHNRWKNLKFNDFYSKIEYKETSIEKGYYYIEAVIPADDSKYMEYTDEIEQIPKTSQIYIKLIKEYCDINGIEFVILSVPSAKNWNYARHNAIKEFTNKEGIEFIDLNEKKDEINIDWKNETGDGGDHINYKGAIKVTDYIGKWLNNKNILKNHKNDKRYEKWNEDLEKFKEKYTKIN